MTETALSSLGAVLRERREALGMTIESISETTRVQPRYLRALEDGDHARLPAPAYVRGFLRLYAEHLGLDPESVIADYHAERALLEAPVSASRIHGIAGRALVITPAALLPLIAVAAVVAFGTHLSNTFISNTTPPRLDITDPSGEVVVQSPDFTIRGRTVPEARITVVVFPRVERYAEWRAASDGAFAVPVRLTKGLNRIEVEVIDAQSRLAKSARTIEYALPEANPNAPALQVEQPTEGARVTDAPVTVAGRVTPGAQLTVNGAAVAVDAEGRFHQPLALAAGQRAISIVARTPSGGEAQETRTVTVAYTRVNVVVELKSRAWLLVQVDGKDDPRTNRVYENATLVFSGTTVSVRSGNAGATHVTVNGRELGAMGKAGEVAEATYRPE